MVLAFIFLEAPCTRIMTLYIKNSRVFVHSRLNDPVGQAGIKNKNLNSQEMKFGNILYCSKTKLAKSITR